MGLSPNDFPLVCPEDEILRKILHVSLDHERRLRSNNSNVGDDGGDFDGNDNSIRHWHWGPDEESRHEDRFWKVVRDAKKFCTVDFKQVVRDDKWIKFFTTMDKI